MIRKDKFFRYFKGLYTKYVIKLPVFAFLVLFVGFVLLFFVVRSTDTDVFKTFNGNISIDAAGTKQIIVDVSADDGCNLNDSSRVFWYTDKRVAIHAADDFDIMSQDGLVRVVIRPAGEPASALADTAAVQVDLAIGKQTLLDRIFGKGVQKLGIR
jgi:hypothetical protein